MFDDVVQDVRVHVETVVSAKTGEPEERILALMCGCATETYVREEADAMKDLLVGIETRFREEHAALVDATTAQMAVTKV